MHCCNFCIGQEMKHKKAAFWKYKLETPNFDEVCTLKRFLMILQIVIRVSQTKIVRNKLHLVRKSENFIIILIMLMKTSKYWPSDEDAYEPIIYVTSYSCKMTFLGTSILWLKLYLNILIEFWLDLGKKHPFSYYFGIPH